MTETWGSEQFGTYKTKHIWSSHVSEDNDSMEGSSEFLINAFEIATEVDDWIEIHKMEVQSEETGGE